MTNSTRCLVIQPHDRSYDDPITLTAGERIAITGRDVWDGKYVWLWCINAAEKAGWVPEAFLEVSGSSATVTRDYSALELTVRPGQRLTILATESGWHWCEDAEGQRGWVPVTCCAPGL